MKIRFIKMLSILYAVMLMICAVSVWAAAETAPATPTDLGPVENGEEEQETEDGPVDSIEILITKNLTLGQSWEGTVGKTKPAVLKLDLERAGTVYMVLEGKDAWATVEKSDRMTGNAPRRQVNPETDELIYSWEAEAGSYIITVGPVEPNLMAMVKATFMTTGAYDAWEEARSTEEEPEEEPDEESEEEPKEESEPEKTEQEEEPDPEQGEKTEPQSEEEPNPEQQEGSKPEEEFNPESGEENKPEGNTEPQSEEEPNTEQPEENKPEEENGNVPEEMQPEENRPESFTETERSVDFSFSWDSDNPRIGDTVHFKALLKGYDQLNYTVQWQLSADCETWSDYPGANTETVDIVITKELDNKYWRLVIYVEELQDE